MTINVASAGSLAPAIRAIVDRFIQERGRAVAVRHGPAGLLAETIIGGTATDIYISASTSGPRLLSERRLFDPPVVIAHNRMALTARPGIVVNPDDPLATLADPRWKIGMSTPGADPSGDYAVAFLDALARDRPELAADMRRRTASLFGDTIPDPGAPQRSPAPSALGSGTADILIGYWTGALAISREMPLATVCLLPANYAPPTTVCASCRTGSPAEVVDLLDYLQCDVARAELEDRGFLLPEG